MGMQATLMVASCSCLEKASGQKNNIAVREQKLAEAFAGLPIAIPAKNGGGSYPLIQLICEYSPWFLVSHTNFHQSWIAQNGVDRPATGCNHVTKVALNYEWPAAGSGRICDIWRYINGQDVIFNRDDIAKLQQMTLLRNDTKEHESFEFEDVTSQFHNSYTQGVGFDQFAKLNVLSHMHNACVQEQQRRAQEKQAQETNSGCFIL